MGDVQNLLHCNALRRIASYVQACKRNSDILRHFIAPLYFALLHYFALQQVLHQFAPPLKKPDNCTGRGERGGSTEPGSIALQADRVNAKATVWD